MLFQAMVDKVNNLNQSDGDLSYLELKEYFDECMDELNQAIHRELFDYFPDTFLEDDNYIGIPNRFQSRFICYFVAAKTLAEIDDFDDQKMEYDRVWQTALAQYVNYYFDEIQPIELTEGYGVNVDGFMDYWEEEEEETE